eukprot:COSAG06_NODE_360_length_16832_cov_9.250209_18_plen_64_part_00
MNWTFTRRHLIPLAAIAAAAISRRERSERAIGRARGQNGVTICSSFLLSMLGMLGGKFVVFMP